MELLYNMDEDMLLGSLIREIGLETVLSATPMVIFDAARWNEYRENDIKHRGVDSLKLLVRNVRTAGGNIFGSPGGIMSIQTANHMMMHGVSKCIAATSCKQQKEIGIGELCYGNFFEPEMIEHVSQMSLEQGITLREYLQQNIESVADIYSEEVLCYMRHYGNGKTVWVFYRENEAAWRVNSEIADDETAPGGLNASGNPFSKHEYNSDHVADSLFNSIRKDLRKGE